MALDPPVWHMTVDSDTAGFRLEHRKRSDGWRQAMRSGSGQPEA